MKYLMLTLSLTLFAGTTRAEAPEVTVTTELPAGIELKQITTDKAAKVERVVAWKTSKGTGVAVFATVEKSGQKDDMMWWSKGLYVTTFDTSGKKPKKVREVKELEPPCELDLSARFFHPVSGLEVTDLDGDGVAELTFGYKTRCAGDVSPHAMKVLVLEGKDKHILRGESKVGVGPGEIVGGEYKADFGKNTTLLDHAKAVWDANVGP